jgi:amino acid transporter
MTTNTVKIGVSTATIIGMNAMIGAGIFTAPAAMASLVGPAGILAYLFVVLCVWFLAQSLARLAALYPQEGSFYVYASKWGGHIVGLIAGGAYLTGLMIAMGLLSQVAGTYLHPLFPSLSAYTLSLITLASITLLNMCGVALSELGQQILIVCTTFPIIVTTILCLSKANFAYLTPFAPYGFMNIFKATHLIIFGFFGFECAASLFSIVDNPGKNVPRALTYSIVIVGTLYTLFVASLILSTPLEYFTNPHVLIPDILANTFPNKPWLIKAVHLSIVSAVIGTIHSMIWSSGTLLVSLLKKFKNGTVQHLIHRSVISNRTAVLCIGICIAITFSTITNVALFSSLTSLCIITAFLLSIITLLTIPTEWSSARNIQTMLGVITALAILYFALLDLGLAVCKVI